MALRFFFDECADEDVAVALRAHGIDVITTTEAGRKGYTDEAQLSYALDTGRVVYTTDADFLRLAHLYLTQGRPFAGIAYHSPGRYSKREIIDALLLMNAIYEPGEVRDRVEFL